jgi:ferric-chelate reductase (NADPH)
MRPVLELGHDEWGCRMSVLTETLADLASNALLRNTRVTKVVRLTPEFVQIELQAEAFRGATWVPGAKLQMRPRRGTLLFRTYTPTRWDPDGGATELIVFTHGEGPAADWFRQVTVDDVCEVFGPRKSIELSRLSDHVVFVGDESSVGLACALRTVTSQVSYVFEATEPEGLRKALSDLQFADGCAVVARTPERSELLEHAREAADTTADVFDLVVTGDAGTVHSLRRDSRRWSRPPRRMTGKAYWAPGRTGLD